MRPVKITVDGINSFSEAQTLDFQALGNLFCIAGKTGSGKSTILDCIVLALYGKGSRKGSVIGDYINLKRASASVSFSFEDGGRLYRVERVFYRTGKSAKAALYEDERLVADSAADVTERVKNIIGLAREDFTQVMVLEQGEFDKFIAADKARRSETVGNLFKLSRYRELYGKFSARKKLLESEREQLFKRIEPVAYATDEAEETLEREIAEAEGQLAAVARDIESAAALKTTLDAQKVRAEQAERVADERKRLVTLLKQLDEAKLRLEAEGRAAAARVGKAAADRASTETAKKTAARIEYFINNSDEAELNRRREAFLADYDVLKTQAGKLKGELTVKYVELERRKERFREAMKEVAAAVDVSPDTDENELAGLKAFWTGRIEERDRVAARIEDGLKKLRESEKRKNEAVERCESAIRIRGELTAEAGVLTAALEAERVAVSRRAALDAVSELRRGLKAGDICPLCGGIVGKGEPTSCPEIDESRLAELTVKLNETREKITLAEKLNASAAAESEVLKNAIGERREELASLVESFETLKRGVEASEGLEARFDRAIAASPGGLTAEIAASEGELRLAEVKLEATVKEGRGLRERLAELERRRLELCGGRPPAELLGELKAEIASAEEEETAAAAAERELAEKLRASSSAAAAAEGSLAALPPERNESFDADAWESAVAAAAQLQTRFGALNSASAAACERLKRLRTDKSIKQRIDAELALNERTLGDISILLPMLSGDKFLEFAAEEYILQFTDSASRLLGQMTGGKYTLTYDGSDGCFYVADYLNGNELRKIGTLSGGETFLASLSIAMAISREIARYYSYEFFFLDEGFGTLDPESLETVTAGLYELSRDTVVGVITHRSELTDALPQRVTVVGATESSGSKITFN